MSVEHKLHPELAEALRLARLYEAGNFHTDEDWLVTCGVFARSLLGLEEQLEAAHGALRTWQQVSPVHRYECNPFSPDGKGCTCGLQAVRDVTRHVLGDSFPAMNPLSPATVGEEEPGRKATGTGDVDTSAEKQRRSGSSISFQESAPNTGTRSDEA